MAVPVTTTGDGITPVDTKSVSANGSTAQPVAWWRDPTAAAVLRAFMLGWKITELRSRITITNRLAQEIHADSNQQAALCERLKQAYGDPFWNTSVWRATFNQIATMHASVFGDASTANTVYQPQGGWQSIEELQCLFPQAAPAYSDIGVISATFTNQATGQPITFDRFQLYDVTRRALNCLGLLHVMPEPGNQLLDESIQSYTGNLLAQMRVPVGSRLGSQAVVDQYTAIQAMTEIASELLAAWDSFVRENYYNGGSIKNDPHEQLAFEAGSAMAALSWQLTVTTIVPRLEAAAAEAGPSDPATRAGAERTVIAQLYQSWKQTLAQRNITYIEHQLTGLGAILDEAYYATSKKPRPDPTPGGKRPFDPYLPSQALSCVSTSLGFWRKAILWLDPLVTPPQGVAAHALSLPLERSLWGALVEQSTVWQALITGEQQLDSYGVETVMHKVVEDVIGQFREEVAAGLKGSLRDTLTAALRQLAPVALVLLLLSIPGVLWLVLTRPAFAGALNPNGLWAVLGAGPILASVFGFRSVTGALRSSPPATASVATTAPGETGTASSTSSPLVAHLQGMLGSIDTTLLKMLESASEQIQIDLAAMNHEIGISYPLLDGFIESPLGETVTTDFSFMSQVIWSPQERQEEVEGIVRAALGPIGLLIGEHLAEATARSSTGGQPASVSIAVAGATRS